MQYSKNIQILKYGLIVVLLCLIISITFYLQFSLDEPVFLKHYYDLVIRENSRINLHLITNSSDTRRILRIEFPQMPKDFAYIEMDYLSNSISGNGYLRFQKFAHYNCNEIALKVASLYDEVENNTNERSVVLDKAVIYYNSGDQQEVDIGKIILHKNIVQTDNLTSTFSKSSSDDTSAVGFKSNDNLIIESIESGLDEELEGILKLTFEVTNIDDLNYPVYVETGGSFRIESEFIFDPEDSRIFNVYDINKKISLTDSQGNNESIRIWNLDYYPWDVFRTERGIIQYLKERGVR